MCLGLTLKSLPLASGLNTTWAQPKNWKTTRFATMRCYYGHNSIHETSSWPTFDQRASEWRAGACGMAFMGITMVITTITLDRACLAILKQSETSPLKIHFQPLLLGQLQKPLPRGPLTGLSLASFGNALNITVVNVPGIVTPYRIWWHALLLKPSADRTGGSACKATLQKTWVCLPWNAARTWWSTMGCWYSFSNDFQIQMLLRPSCDFLIPNWHLAFRPTAGWLLAPLGLSATAWEGHGLGRSKHKWCLNENFTFSSSW